MNSVYVVPPEWAGAYFWLQSAAFVMAVVFMAVIVRGWRK